MVLKLQLFWAPSINQWIKKYILTEVNIKTLAVEALCDSNEWLEVFSYHKENYTLHVAWLLDS